MLDDGIPIKRGLPRYLKQLVTATEITLDNINMIRHDTIKTIATNMLTDFFSMIYITLDKYILFNIHSTILIDLSLLNLNYSNYHQFRTASVLYKLSKIPTVLNMSDIEKRNILNLLVNSDTKELALTLLNLA